MLIEKRPNFSEWNQSIPQCKAELKKDQNIKQMPEMDEVDENHFPPTAEEQKLIDSFKQNCKLVKQRHNTFYVHCKMHYVMAEIASTFPSPAKIPVPGGGYVLRGNTDYLKSIILHCKVRMEINHKLYALSEYVTWSYQDHTTDPGERIKRSVVVIIH